MILSRSMFLYINIFFKRESEGQIWLQIAFRIKWRNVLRW